MKILVGMSGGVDSSVAALLIHKAIGDQLVCVFVNNGLLRKNEAENVINLFGKHTDESNGMFEFQRLRGHDAANGRCSGVSNLDSFLFLVTTFGRGG